MDEIAIRIAIDEALSDEENGGYQKAAVKLAALHECVAGTGWPEVAIGIERATLHINQGLYSLAEGIAKPCAAMAKSLKWLPQSSSSCNLLEKLASVTWYIAAMNLESGMTPAVVPWHICRGALEGLSADDLDEQLRRPYVSEACEKWPKLTC